MREMKNSGIEWIGDIPSDWEIHRVKNHYSIVSGSGFKPDLQGKLSGDYPVCKASDISSAEKDLFFAANYITVDIANREGFSVIPSGSIIFAKIGEAMRKNNRSICRVDCCADNNCQGLVPNNIDVDYGYYLFNCIDMKWFDNAGTVPCINNQKLKDCGIPFPNIIEQKIVSNFLDEKCAEIDTVIEKTKATIEEYKKLKQSVITQAVTKGIRPNRPMKDSGIEWIGEIPADWEHRKLFRAIDNMGDIDHYMPDSVMEYGVPYLMTGDLKPQLSEIAFDKCKQVSKDDYILLSSKIKAEKGDVIFARYATIGTVCYVNIAKDFLVSYSCLTIKPSKEYLDGKFLFYYLKSAAFFEDIKQYINSNTQSNVGLDSMCKARIVLPNIYEQKEIIDYLDKKCSEIDELITKKTSLLSELESYKKSLIYEYVTGKKEV